MTKLSFRTVSQNFISPGLILLSFVWLIPLLTNFTVSFFNFSFYTGYQSWLLSDIMLYPLPIICLAIYLRNKNKATVVWETPKLFKILLSLFVVVLYFLFTIISHNFFPVSVSTNQTQLLNTLNNSSILGIQLELLAITLLGPIFEELMCRGLLMNFYFKNSKFGFDVILSAIVFSLLHQHQNLSVLLPYFIFGLLLGLLYRFTGKLQYTMLAHILINTIIAWPYIQDNIIIFL